VLVLTSHSLKIQILLKCDAVSLGKYICKALIFRVKQSKMTVDDCITLKMKTLQFDIQRTVHHDILL